MSALGVFILLSVAELLAIIVLAKKLWGKQDQYRVDNETLARENYQLKLKMDKDRQTIDHVRTEVSRVRDKASSADLDSLIGMLP